MGRQRAVDADCSCQLNRIIGPQGVALNEINGQIHNNVIRRDQPILGCTVRLKSADQLGALAPGYDTFPGASSQGAGSLCSREVSDADDVAGGWIGDRSHPLGTGLIHVPLDDATGIELVKRH